MQQKLPFDERGGVDAAVAGAAARGRRGSSVAAPPAMSEQNTTPLTWHQGGAGLRRAGNEEDSQGPAAGWAERPNCAGLGCPPSVCTCVCGRVVLWLEQCVNLRARSDRGMSNRCPLQHSMMPLLANHSLHTPYSNAHVQASSTKSSLSLSLSPFLALPVSRL